MGVVPASSLSYNVLIRETRAWSSAISPQDRARIVNWNVNYFGDRHPSESESLAIVRVPEVELRIHYSRSADKFRMKRGVCTVGTREWIESKIEHCFQFDQKTCQSHINHRRFNTKNDDVPKFDIYRVRQRDSSKNLRNRIIQLDTHLVYSLERVKSTKGAPCLHHFP